MADNITETETVIEQANPDASQELAQSMALALGGYNPNKSQEQQIINEQNAGVSIVQDAPPINFDVLKDKYNYQSPEDAIKEIEELRAFKATPVAPDIKFENEESKKYFNAIQAGKMEEVFEIASKQRELDKFTSLEVNKDNAADIIKLGMKYKYMGQGLSDDDINYRFKKQFALPKEPVLTDLDDETEFKAKHDYWKEQVADIEREKIIEAKLIKPELEAQKSKLVLPELPKEVDQDYESWKQSRAQEQKIDTETISAYKSFTPKTLEEKINFNDEANKIAFEFQYEPTPEDLSSTVDMVVDINKFFNHFITDGKPDRERFAKAINFAVNREKILNSAMNQSKNATLKSRLPNNNGYQRQMPQGQEVNQMDLLMQQNGIGRN